MSSTPKESQVSCFFISVVRQSWFLLRQQTSRVYTLRYLNHRTNARKDLQVPIYLMANLTTEQGQNVYNY